MSIASCVDYFENNRMVCCVFQSSRVKIYRPDNYYKQMVQYMKNHKQFYILTCHEDSSIVITDYLKKSQVLKINDSYK
ncbi:hypothetical protein pb186bvf_016370 [Paramecium bursaria]